MDSKKGFYKILELVKSDIEQGHSLSEALERHPDYFPTLYVANVRAGEKGGNLVERLKDYQLYIKKVDELRRKIVSSSIYPIMILAVILIAVFFLFTYVIPNFSKIYLDAKVELPLITRIMLAITKFFQYILPVLIFLVLFFFLGYRRYAKSERGRLTIDRFKLKIPLVSEIYKNYLLSNFSRTLSAILKGGIPLLSALKTSAGVVNNAYYSEKIKEVTKKVEEGNSLSASLEETGLFPSIALRLIKAGEGSGALWEMLDEVSDYYDTLVNEALTVLTTLVEPALMIVMGVIVGTIVVAMYLPIFSLAGAVGG
jgi:type IV pilus assembly protein PilC